MTSPRPAAAQPIAGLDFNDLARTQTPITLGGQTWQIADDFDSRLGLEMFLLRSMPLGTRIQDATKRLGDDPAVGDIEAAARTAAERYGAQVAHAVALLFQHSGYPDMSDERVGNTFSLAEQERILGHFFPLATTPSSPPSNAGTTTPSAPETTTTTS